MSKNRMATCVVTLRRDNVGCWLVGCFGFKGPLRQYFSLYRTVSQREGERGERIDESKNVQTTPPVPTASAIGPCPTVIKIVGRPGILTTSVSTMCVPVKIISILKAIKSNDNMINGILHSR